MSYQRNPDELLATTKQLFDEMSAKYGGIVAEEKIFNTKGSPSHQHTVRPLGLFGKRRIGMEEETYRAAIRWCSAYPLDLSKSGSSRLELLPRMPRTIEDIDGDGIFRVKPVFTLYAIKRSACGSEYGSKFYLKRSAQFQFSDGFSYYEHEYLCPLVSEMFVRFGELTSGFAFYTEPEYQYLNV